MKKRNLVIIAGMLIITVPLVIGLQQLYSRIVSLKELLSPEHIGLLYRAEQESELASLQYQFAIMILLTLTWVSGIVAVIANKKIVLPIILLLLSTMICPSAGARNLYYMPRMTVPRILPTGITYVESYVTITVSILPRNAGFVAYFIAIGNPVTQDFIEVGYAYDASGAFLYSSHSINEQYGQVKFSDVQNGEVHYFHIIYGWETLVIGDTWYDSIIFPVREPLEFTIQGETPDSRNTMDGKFAALSIWEQIAFIDNSTEMDEFADEYGFPVAYTTIISSFPYTMNGLCTGNYYTGATINGGDFPRTGHGSGKQSPNSDMDR